MKPFKFFQKEKKPMFSSLLERLQDVSGIPTRHNLGDYIDEMDNQVIQMVYDYFSNNSNITSMETEFSWITITTIEHSNPESSNIVRDGFNIHVNVDLKNVPYCRYQYVIHKAIGRFPFITEKRIEYNGTV